MTTAIEPFPITIEKKSRRAASSTGGKDFHSVLIETSDGRGLVIFRYGKKGQWGPGWTVQQHFNVNHARNAVDKKWRDKDREYRDIIGDVAKTVGDFDDFMTTLNAKYWANLLKEQAEWLIPGCDTSMCKGPDRGARDMDFNPLPEPAAPPKPEKPKPPEPTVDELRKQMPGWGMF